MAILKSKIFKIILLLGVLFFLWTNYLWKFFSQNYAGSYAYAETWCLKVKEKELLEIIKTIQKEHPELKPPNTSFPFAEKNRYWTKITFYYTDTKQNVYTWTRPNADSLYTTFAFVAVANHLDSLTPIKGFRINRREINNDFGYFENKSEIKKFEKKILKLIEQKIDKDKIPL